MKLRKTILIILALCYAVLWFGGTGSYIFFTQPPPEATWAAPSFLFLAGLIIIVASDRKSGLLLLLAGFIGLISEIIGVHTGLPYGKYYYTESIGPNILGVPLVMMTAWIIIPAYIRQLIYPLNLKPLLFIASGAGLMVLIDLLIDPVAINPMKLWIWINNGLYYGIPTMNFIGWFFVSAVIFSFLHRNPARNVWHLFMGTSIIFFFTIIAFAEKLFLAGIAGILVVILQIVVEFQSNALSIIHAPLKKKEIK
jgi:uncharacterized membrane protein